MIDDTPLTEEQEYENLVNALESGNKPPEKTADKPVEAPEVAAVEPTPETTPPVAEPFEGFSLLPEDVRKSLSEKLEAAERAKSLEEKARDFENRWKSQHNQLAPVQRQNREMARRIQELEERTKAPPAQTVAKEKLEQYKQNLPEEAEVVLGLIRPLEEELATLKQQRQTDAQRIAEQQEYVRVSRELAELTKFRPTWQEDLPILNQWIDLLPAGMREEASELAHSDHVSDVKKVWRWFGQEEELAKAYNALQQQQPTAPEPKRPRSTDPNPRNRQSAPPSAVNASDPREQDWVKFNEWYEQQTRR